MTASTRRRFVQGTTAAAMSTFFIGRARAEDAEYVMKVATVAPPGTPWAADLKRRKKDVKEKSGGRIKVKTYLGGALGDEIATAEACKRGTIQCWGGSTGSLASAVPELGAIELPYLFDDEKKADNVLDNVIFEDLKTLLWDRGYVLVYFTENGYRSLGSKFAVHSPHDLKGKKMRCQPGDVHEWTMSALGASPNPMSVTEVMTALQSGVVDGFDNTPLFAFAASWYQAISHFTLSKHIYQPGVVVLSRKWYESLPTDLQQVAQMGDPLEMAKKGRRDVRAIGPMLEQNFVDAGIQLIKLSSSERNAFASKCESVHGKWRGKASKEGKALLDKIKAAL